MRRPLWRRRQDEELDEELASHLRMAIADRVARGEDPDEATRAARRELGNVGVIKEVTRDMWGWTALEQVARDIRFACRTLRKSPGFTIVAVVTLALGIGANTAMFSVINAVLLRPLPFPSPDRLAAVTEVDFRRMPGGTSSSVSWPNFFDWRSRSHVFEHLSAYRDADFTVATGDRPLHVPGAVVSSEFFSTLGVAPVLGRGFNPTEERAGSDVAVISDELWRSEFSASSDVVGRSVRINARPFTIIGVMPARFRFPISAPQAQLWATVAEDARVESADDEPLTTQRGAHFLKVVARLRPGATIAIGQAELDLIAAALAAEHPDDDAKRGVAVASQLEALVGDRRQALLILLAAVGCVLLIACVNLANLLLARGAGRDRELSLRAALGASSRRILSLLMTESAVLTLAGTACGLALAYWTVGLLVTLSPVEIRGLNEVTIDGTVLTFTAIVAAASALTFGMIPALQGRRVELTAALQGGRRATGGAGQQRLRGALVVAETAIGVVLLIGAGLLLRGFDRLTHTEPGFDPRGVITARFRLPDSRYPYLKQVAFYEALLPDIGAIPGVQASAATAPLPLSGSRYTISFELTEGRTSPSDRLSAGFGMASPGYFLALRIPLIRGRDFQPSDNDASPRVVIVNESFARTYFSDRNPIGERIKLSLSTTERETPWREIVGVVGDIRHGGLGEPARPAYFVPYAQGLISPLYLVIRADRDPSGIVEAVRKKVASKDPELPLYDVKPLTKYVQTSVAGERFETSLLAVFALLGLTLTAVGLYGVMTYGVVQRTREFGIRLALGARPQEVRSMVVRGGVVLAAAGLLIGTVAGAFAGRALAGTITGVDPLDPVAFGSVAALLFVVAILASYLPARRATKVDPMLALRCE